MVSESGVLFDNRRALSSYYDVLLKHSFGNFRNLLEDVTLHPAMGSASTCVATTKGNLALGAHPNEITAAKSCSCFRSA